MNPRIVRHVAMGALALGAFGACSSAHPQVSGMVEVAPTPPVLVHLELDAPDARYGAAARQLCAGAVAARPLTVRVVDRRAAETIVILADDTSVVSCVLGHDTDRRRSALAQTVLEGVRRGALTADGIEVLGGHIRLFGEAPDGATRVLLVTAEETIEATVGDGYYALSGEVTAMPTALEARDADGALVERLDRAGMATLVSAFSR